MLDSPTATGVPCHPSFSECWETNNNGLSDHLQVRTDNKGKARHWFSSSFVQLRRPCSWEPFLNVLFCPMTLHSHKQTGSPAWCSG